MCQRRLCAKEGSESALILSSLVGMFACMYITIYTLVSADRNKTAYYCCLIVRRSTTGLFATSVRRLTLLACIYFLRFVYRVN